MKKKSTPAPQRAGTAKHRTLYSRRERARREAVVVRHLEELSVSNPDRFDAMLKLLAKLLAEVEREVDPGAN